ncbi:MAG TPA: hypothetical protein PLP05_02175 [Sedimentisphaerales bacterium]|nr:hypothetical protein [Sedimentisphaerales bacterium]
MRKFSELLLVLVMSLPVPGLAVKPKGVDGLFKFQTDSIKVVLDLNTGSLREVDNLLTDNVYLISNDTCLIESNGSMIDLAKVPMKLVKKTKTSCEFVGKSGDMEVVRKYVFKNDRSYFDRHLAIKNTSKTKSIVIKNITDCSLDFQKPFESVHYHNDGMDQMDPGSEMFHEMTKPVIYQNALNIFMRNSEGGLFAGLKYPYWKYLVDNSSMKLNYETNYRIKPQETLELPEMFCGVYKKTGYTCRKELDWKPRILITEQEEMDWGEVRAMQRVVGDYIPEEKCPGKGYYLWLNSWWANPDLRGKIDEKTALLYCNQLKKCQQSKCIDALLIAPVWVGWAGFIEPGPEIDSIGEDADFPMNEQIEKVLSFSKSIGIPILAFCEPGSLNRHYRKDKPDWSLQAIDEPNSFLNQKCWANDDYANWFYRLTCNTIDKCGLNGWAWDHTWVHKPMICYGKNHGHESGNCEFQQYRNVTGYIQKLRVDYPNHLFEVYWGLKTAGTWAHKGLNTLENIYENGSPCPPGMTMADDLRFQHWYNHNYRFFPTYMNMGHFNFDNKEGNGHLYSILSVLSASSHGQLNDWTAFDTQTEADMVFAQLRKWKSWASQNIKYLKDRVDLFGQPCRKNGIDGTAHIIGDRGYIFIFNPCNDIKYGSITLDEMIGLTKGGRFSLEEISHSDKKRLGVYRHQEDFVFAIEPKSAMLIEIKPTSEKIDHIASFGADVEIQPAF